MSEEIYFNPGTYEVVSIAAGGEAPGPGWSHVTREQECRLTPVHQLLVRLGVVDDATAVYWYMPPPSDGGTMPFDEFPACAA